MRRVFRRRRPPPAGPVRLWAEPAPARLVFRRRLAGVRGRRHWTHRRAGARDREHPERGRVIVRRCPYCRRRFRGHADDLSICRACLGLVREMLFG